MYSKDGVWDWKNVTTTANVNEAELKELQGFSRYCIKVSAFTRIGDGTLSAMCAYGHTHEGGKCALGHSERSYKGAMKL